jgi:exodeoxyribonuclease V alpha subunit
LVYTGLTRGKQLVVLVGQKKALTMAVKNHLGRKRYTKLAEWLGMSGAPGGVTGPQRATP